MPDVIVELPEPTPVEESAPDVVVVNAGSDSTPATSDVVVEQLIELNNRMSALETENQRLRDELYETQAQTAIAAAEAETALEVIEEASEPEPEPEPEVKPADDEKPSQEHAWFAPIGHKA